MSVPFQGGDGQEHDDDPLVTIGKAVVNEFGRQVSCCVERGHISTSVLDETGR